MQKCQSVPPCPRQMSAMFRRKIRNIPSWFVLAAAALLLIGCQTKENPAIQVNNQPNETGGQLVITGSGFIAGNPVTVGILNAPGGNAPWSQSAGKADGTGKINVTVTYNFAPQGKLPGCQTGNNTKTNLNVTATDSSTHTFAAGTSLVADCEWSTPQVSSHQ